MFKVSFKKEYKKVQIFNNRATLVTLIGELKMPVAVYNVLPDVITDWMWEHQGIDVQWGNCSREQEAFRLEVTGKSVCAEGDVFDSLIGQRIAESRAKIKLYKFMHTLCEKTLHYYYSIMYGNAEVHLTESHTEAPKDCLHLTCQKYRDLLIKESYHLGKLLEEA